MELISIKEAVEGLAATKPRRGGKTTKPQITEWQLLQLIRRQIVPPGTYIRLGRRVLLDKDRWEQFLAAGGASFPTKRSGRGLVQ